MTTVTYSAVGSVRGSCGHAHRTAAAAQRCADRDHRGVRAGHGRSAYSDRTVARSDGRPLTEREADECEAVRI